MSDELERLVVHELAARGLDDWDIHAATGFPLDSIRDRLRRKSPSPNSPPGKPTPNQVTS